MLRCYRTDPNCNILCSWQLFSMSPCCSYLGFILFSAPLPPLRLRIFLLIRNCFYHWVSDTHIRPNTGTSVYRAITADGSCCELTPYCWGAGLCGNFKSNTFCIWRGKKLIGFHVSHPSTPWLSSVTHRTPSLQPDMQWRLLKSKWRKWEILVTSNSPLDSLSSFSVNHPWTQLLFGKGLLRSGCSIGNASPYVITEAPTER